MHRLLSKNTQEVVSRNVEPEMHLSIYLSSLLKHYFFSKLSMRDNKREATVFALDKVLPSSHPPCLPPIAPISCLYLFHQILRVHLCITFSFWSLSSPCHSLQSVRKKVSVTFSDFVCLFPSTAFISLSLLQPFTFQTYASALQWAWYPTASVTTMRAARRHSTALSVINVSCSYVNFINRSL